MSSGRKANVLFYKETCIYICINFNWAWIIHFDSPILLSNLQTDRWRQLQYKSSTRCFHRLYNAVQIKPSARIGRGISFFRSVCQLIIFTDRNTLLFSSNDFLHLNENLQRIGIIHKRQLFNRSHHFVGLLYGCRNRNTIFAKGLIIHPVIIHDLSVK